MVAFACLDADLDVFGGHELGEFFAPLDQHDRLLLEQLVESKGAGVARATETVKIDVIDLQALAVFVNQGESGARDFVGLGCAQALHDAHGERGFASAQVADEQHDRPLRKLASQSFTECDGFVFRSCLERGHTGPWRRAGIATGRWR